MHDVTHELIGGLPPYYPSSDSSDNYRFLKAVGRELSGNDLDINDIDTAIGVVGKAATDLVVPAGETYTIRAGNYEEYGTVTVNGTLTVDGTLVAASISGNANITGSGTVRTTEEILIDRLYELGKLIERPPRANEGYESYRARLIAGFAVAASKATIGGLLDAVSIILDIPTTAIDFSEPAGGENGTAQIGVPSEALTDSNISQTDLVNNLEDLIPAGYRIEATSIGTFTYITPTDYDNDLHDSSKGYDGLDTNGDPKNNGGTYAGVIT